ncbi:MAG: uroporphyrinogen decarboxylase [Bacteroidia bacterium]
MKFELSYSEIIGYLASAVVLTSFLMKNLRTLRMVNGIGAILFIIYGCLLNFSIPIIITNVAIACIHVYYLLRPDRKSS